MQTSLVSVCEMLWNTFVDISMYQGTQGETYITGVGRWQVRPHLSIPQHPWPPPCSCLYTIALHSRRSIKEVANNERTFAFRAASPSL